MYLFGKISENGDNMYKVKTLNELCILFWEIANPNKWTKKNLNI